MNLEQQEQERMQKELDNLNQEVSSLEKTLSETEAAAEQKARDAAKEDLKKFRESELAGLLKKAEQDAKDKAAKLQQAYDKNAGSAVDALTKEFTALTSSGN